MFFFVDTLLEVLVCEVVVRIRVPAFLAMERREWRILVVLGDWWDIFLFWSGRSGWKGEGIWLVEDLTFLVLL